MTRTVTFIKSYPPYSTDDVAGFDDDFAQKLIDRGVATAHGDNADVEKARAAQASRDRMGQARPAVLMSPEATHQTTTQGTVEGTEPPVDTTPGSQVRRTTTR